MLTEQICGRFLAAPKHAGRVWNPLIKCGQQCREVLGRRHRPVVHQFCEHPRHRSTLADGTRRDCHSVHWPDGIFRLGGKLGRVRRMADEQFTFGAMRKSGASGVIVFCSDDRCAHSVKLSTDCWPDHLRLSDIESLFVCEVCGNRGADVRPDFDGLRKKAVREQPRTA